ncbi:hypothetical protein N9164_12520 [Draconibacterium sp.]|nr:hypothetical protein [Draconibacterium sp.]
MAYNSTIWASVAVGDYIKRSSVDAINSNVEFVHDSILQISGDGGTHIGDTGTPANFKALRGKAGQFNIIDVADDLGAVTLRGGLTVSGANAASLLLLNSIGKAGATEAAHIRLANIANNRFELQDHDGNNLFVFTNESLVATMGTMRTDDDEGEFEIYAGASAQRGSGLFLYGVDHDATSGDAVRLFMSNKDTTRRGAGFWEYEETTGNSRKIALFDTDAIEFYNPADNSDSVDITPSLRKIQGFDGGVSSWIITAGASAGEANFRFGKVDSTNINWVNSTGTLSAYNGTYNFWRVSGLALEFRGAAGLESKFGQDNFAIRDTSGTKFFGMEAPDGGLLFWQQYDDTDPTVSNNEMWLRESGNGGTLQLKVRTNGKTVVLASVAIPA